MTRSLSHLTGHELAALASPFENPNHRSQRGKNRKITFPDLPADFRH